MPWTKGEQVNLAVSHDHGGHVDPIVRSRPGRPSRAGTAGFAVTDHDSAGNIYVVWADSSNYHTWLSVAARGEDRGVQPVGRPTSPARTADGEPTSTPARRRPCRSIATGAHDRLPVGRRRRCARPRRRRVLRHGVRRRPELGRFQGRVERLREPVAECPRRLADVQPGQATTHPFHYDSICLNGLGCDIAVPAGDRTLADFFAIGYNPATAGSRWSTTATTRSRTSRSGTSQRRWSRTQIAGRRTTAAQSRRRAARAYVFDRSGRRRARRYSLATPAVHHRRRRRRTRRPADFTSASIGKDAATGGFTVTLKVASLSQASLLAGARRHRRPVAPVGLAVRERLPGLGREHALEPGQGFTFGWNDYTTGGSPCLSTTTRRATSAWSIRAASRCRGRSTS